MHETVGMIIKRRLGELRWKRCDLAYVSGVSYGYIGNIINGSTVSVAAASAIAIALGIDPIELLQAYNRTLLAKLERSFTVRAQSAEVRRRAAALSQAHQPQGAAT